MKILVAVKQVPERDAPVHVAADGQVDGRRGCELDDQRAGRVCARRGVAAEGDGGLGRGDCAVCRAGAGVVDAAGGAGEGGGPGGACGGGRPCRSCDTLQLAEVLAEAVRSESPDLVLTGLAVVTTWVWGRRGWCWRSCWGCRTRRSSSRWRLTGGGWAEGEAGA